MSLWKDIVHATRLLRRNPGFTLIAALTLALGIGGSTAIFSLVDSVLLRPLPYRDAQQLVSIKDDLRGLEPERCRHVGAGIRGLARPFRCLHGLSAAWPISANLTGGEHPERVEAVAVSPNYFTMLGAQPQLGRLFGAQDRAAGFAEAAVLSDGLWQRLYGGDPHALGKQIRLDTDLYTIVGVMPPRVPPPGRTLEKPVEVWITAGFTAAPFPIPPVRGVRMLPGAIGRLQAGALGGAGATEGRGFRGGARDAVFRATIRPMPRWTPRLTSLQDRPHRQRANDAAGGLRRRGVRAADLLREHREPGGGEGRQPAARDGGAARHGRRRGPTCCGSS